MADSKLSTSSLAFKQFCWPKLHGNVKHHKVKPLKFPYVRNQPIAKLEKYNTNSMRENGKEIPIACVPPPDYITGFGKITIK